MASVYAAVREETGQANRVLALKILAPNIARDGADQRAFLREAMLAKRLDHPNIVKTYDVGDVDGTMYIAMELLHGASLSACAKRAGQPLPLPIALKVVADVARALHAVHELADPERGPLGLVHQDVSPQNVVIGYDGVVKLLDFGVARLGALEGSRTETVQGKPSYLSPEQVRGKNIDRRTDVFALGVVLWELLAGTRLFKRDSAAATYLAVAQDPIPDVRTLNADVPEDIAETLETALRRDREARFPSADVFRRALEGARHVAELPETTQEELASWVTELVPPTFDNAELEREIRDAPVSSRAVSGSGGSAPSATKAATDATATLISAGAPAAPSSGSVPDLGSPIPDLDLPPRSGRSAAPAPRTSVPKMAAVALDVPPSSGPDSGRSAAPASTRDGPARSASSARMLAVQVAPPAIAFGGDDDDFDMEIERNVASSTMPTAMSSRPSGTDLAARPSMHGGRPSGHAIASTGLEIAHVRARSRSHEEEDGRGPRITDRIVGYVVAGAVFAGAAAGLARLAHHAGGRSLERLMPHAFDGTSAPESGVVALVSLVFAVVLGFAGLKLTPRAWSFVASGGAMLLVALAMVTVTLASTGENPEPPDGALLFPYLFPAAVLLASLGVTGRAAWLFARGGVGRRLGSIPVAAIAGAIAFLAYEMSRLAH